MSVWTQVTPWEGVVRRDPPHTVCQCATSGHRARWWRQKQPLVCTAHDLRAFFISRWFAGSDGQSCLHKSTPRMEIPGGSHETWNYIAKKEGGRFIKEWGAAVIYNWQLAGGTFEGGAGSLWCWGREKIKGKKSESSWRTDLVHQSNFTFELSVRTAMLSHKLWLMVLSIGAARPPAELLRYY